MSVEQLDDLYAQRDTRDSLDERIKTAEWQSVVKAKEREQREIAARANYEQSIEGYREEQEALLHAATQLIAQHNELRLRRDRIEAAYRVIHRLGVTDGAYLPPRIALRIQSEREHRYLVANLKALALGDV